MTHRAVLELADYRRRVAELYASVRHLGAGPNAHRRWIAERDDLFGSHPQSPLPATQRDIFHGLHYWAYDPTFRTVGVVSATDEQRFELPHSDTGTTGFIRVARVVFELAGSQHQLDLYQLDAYGDGLFLPFRDRTNGQGTYGGGRYLLDTAKGADLGLSNSDLLLDFNFAYHPSCTYSPNWSCPLPPPGNQVDLAITAGERLTTS